VAGFPLADDSQLEGAVSDFVHCRTGYKLQPGENVRTHLETLEELGDQMLAERQSGNFGGADIVSQVISFIEQNNALDISVGKVARYLHFTPNYLSTLFRTKTGTTFMKYLTNIRILRAKELLTDPNVKIRRVAEEVGYSSTRYFARLFASCVGCYPSEYRSRFKKPDQAPDGPMVEGSPGAGGVTQRGKSTAGRRNPGYDSK
jgi:two-component system response regulator YesN